LASAPASAVPIDPTPSPTPVLPTLADWQVIELAIDGSPYSVAESDGGWVAVGHAANPGAMPIWFSEDGVDWVAATTIPPVIFEEPVLTDVIPGGPGYVAAGIDHLIDGGPPFIWTSPDGLRWTAEWSGVGGRLGTVVGVAEVGGRFLAGGGLVGDGGFGTGPAVMWSSTNASDWVQTTLDSGGVEGIDVRPPVAFDGHLVAIGSGYVPGVTRVWLSSDGVDWQLQSDDPIWVDTFVDDIAVVNGHLVAVGGVWQDDEMGEIRPAIWTSDDARSWSTQYLGPCCARIQQVTALGDGGLAFAGSVVYTSSDGLSWTLAGTIDGFHGYVTAVVETLTFGQVAVGQGPDGSVLLVPPGQ
jgi:hypothetical protein